MAVALAPLLLGLRYAVIGGQDDPPVLAPRRPAWLRRAVPGAVGVLAFGLALNAADSGSRYSVLTQVIWVLSVVPLAVVGYRPLVAWRIAWLVGLGAILGHENSSQWYPGQIWIFLLVLFAVATAQRQEVMLPVWMASVALTWVGIDEAGRAAAVLVVTGVVVWGYLIQRSRQPRPREQEGDPTRPRSSERLLATVRWVPPAAVQLRGQLARARSSSWIANDLPRALVGGPDDPLPLGRTARSRYLVQVGVLIAALLVALAAGSAAVNRGDLILVLLWPLSAAPLVVALYRPLLAWRLGWLLGLMGLLLAPAESNQIHWSPALIYVFLVVLFVVGSIQPPGVLVWVWLATLPLALPGVDLGGRPAAIVVLTGALLGGYQVQRRRLAGRRLAEAQERGTVLTERARIARELHDVVAHHMSMIAVRTETAPYRLTDLPESARTEFAEISQASREALTEMRRLLGVLRSDEPQLPTAPQPGLADLPELVASARAAGTEVTVDVDAALPELPAAVDVSAYRILQEALTNAARHAPGAAVRVVVGGTAGDLSLSVRNDPSDVPPSDAGAGYGVRGMRERAAMLGGQLRAGPAGDGGFEVSAVLPLQAAR
jgi:signal transduction histidine kinase